MREYGFELQLCAALEDGERLVARQLGAHVHGRRVMDIVLLEPGPNFANRAAITPETIPPRAIESATGPGRATPLREAFDCHPETAREAVERAVEAGFFECTRRSGQPAVRQTARYIEDWFGRLVGVECKPDLQRPGALETQVLTDVRLGLLDAVVLATTSHVTGAHLNRIPDAVGVWEFDPDTGERTVVRDPDRLPTTKSGVEIIERTPARTDVRTATAAEKARHRRRLAERVYGKGWRPCELPACARAEPDADGITHCPWKGRIVRPASDCGEGCNGYEPADAVEIDRDACRAARSAWEPDPPGRRRTQAGLDRF